MWELSELEGQNQAERDLSVSLFCNLSVSLLLLIDKKIPRGMLRQACSEKPSLLVCIQELAHSELDSNTVVHMYIHRYSLLKGDPGVVEPW